MQVSIEGDRCGTIDVIWTSGRFDIRLGAVRLSITEQEGRRLMEEIRVAMIESCDDGSLFRRKKARNPVLALETLTDIQSAEKTAGGIRDTETARIRGLKDCPFCGARVRSIRMRVNRDLPETRIMKTIQCSYCGAQTQESAADVEWHVMTWNRRIVP